MMVSNFDLQQAVQASADPTCNVWDDRVAQSAAPLNRLISQYYGDRPLSLTFVPQDQLNDWL